MKRFLINISLFFLPILFLGIGAELLIRHIPNDYKVKKRYLDEHSRNINTLILGSSHAYYGVDPAYMHAGTFNAANINQSLEFDLAMLKKYDGQWDSLRYIVLPVDYNSLFMRLINSTEKWRVKNYNIYYGITTFNRNIDDYSEVLSFPANLTINRLRYYYRRHRSGVTISPLGWGNDHLSVHDQDLPTTAVLALKRHTETSKLQNFNANKTALAAILEYAKAHHVKVLLYTSPMCSDYLSLLDPAQMDTTLQTVTTLAWQYPNVAYYNLLADLSFGNSDFYDADHLNERGAQKLSRKIDGLLKLL